MGVCPVYGMVLLYATARLPRLGGRPNVRQAENRNTRERGKGMRYACEYEGHNKLLTKAHVIVVTIKNDFYPNRKISICGECAKKVFPWLDFSWAMTEKDTKGERE